MLSRLIESMVGACAMAYAAYFVWGFIAETLTGAIMLTLT